MATINVAKVQPRRHVQVRHFPEGASQTFVRGDLLTFSGTSDTGNRVIKATSGTTKTYLVGFAAESASGTAGTMIAVWLADEMAEFTANICTVTCGDDTIDLDDLGKAYGLIADTTNAAWRVNLAETTTNNAFVAITEIIDASGDTNGRVAFKLLKSVVDAETTIGHMINQVRAF
jgi:hypothetical protein